jgi:TolB-like protein
MPDKDDFVPSVVIYVEEGEVRLVQSDVPVTVYLVNYDITSIEDAVVLERSEYDCDADYVDIDELVAEVDSEAVATIADMYYDTYGVDVDKTDDRVAIRKD